MAVVVEPRGGGCDSCGGIAFCFREVGCGTSAMGNVGSGSVEASSFETMGKIAGLIALVSAREQKAGRFTAVSGRAEQAFLKLFGSTVADCGSQFAASGVGGNGGFSVGRNSVFSPAVVDEQEYMDFPSIGYNGTGACGVRNDVSVVHEGSGVDSGSVEGRSYYRTMGDAGRVFDDNVDRVGETEVVALSPALVSTATDAAGGMSKMPDVGCDRYVPPFKRGPKGGKSIGRGPNYLKNQAARERRAAVKRVGKGSDSEASYVDKGKYINKASFFDGMPKSQVDELQRTRTEAMLAKNRAEIVRQRTAEKRAVAEATLLDRELESGAFENRIRTRNEAMDRRSQDQSENVEFYRNARGWAETIKSGEPTPVRGPSNVPSLSSGGSPRSESDWELEVKRRDDQNEALRVENSELRKELETYEQSAYDPMKGAVSVYEPCEYVMDGASRFDQAGFMEEYRQKDRARDFSVPLGTHIRPKEEVKLVGM